MNEEATADCGRAARTCGQRSRRATVHKEILDAWCFMSEGDGEAVYTRRTPVTTAATTS